GVLGELLFQPVGVAAVVAGHEGDVAAAAGRQGAVGGDAWPAVLLADRDDPRVGERPHDVRGAVGRAVVHDDDLEVGDRLVEDAADGLGDVFLVVIGGQA